MKRARTIALLVAGGIALSGCLKVCPGSKACPDNQFAARPAEAAEAGPPAAQ